MDPELVEYESLRAETAHARSAQQQVIQWSLAAFGVLFAAGLVTATNQGGELTDLAQLVRIVVFGVALPLLAVGACLAWAGEQIRMERVGLYLRGREASFWKGPEPSNDAPVLMHDQYPLFWENYIAFYQRTPGGGKQWEGYLGPAMIYGGSYVASFSIFLVSLWGLTDSAGWRLLGGAWVIVLSVFSAWVFLLRIGRRLFRMSRSAAARDDP